MCFIRGKWLSRRVTCVKSQGTHFQMTNNVHFFFLTKKGTWYKNYCVPVYVTDLVYNRQYTHASVVLQPAKRTPPKNQPHQISNTQRTENKTTDVVIQQHNRRLLKMDILMSERCWAHNKWNKIASDIKLVFHSSTITMMHGPINIRFALYYLPKVIFHT